MILESFPLGPLQANCTLIGDETTHEAVVVDPGDEAPRVLHRLEELGLSLKGILLTHGHLDHAGATAALCTATGAPLSLHPADLPLLESMAAQATWMGMAAPEVHKPENELADGVTVGLATFPLKVIFTPGHTQGSCCLYAEQEKLLIAGDTLFAGSIGRTDLPGGDFPSMMKSLKRLLELPDDTRVICGHGSSTTIGRERNSNPYLP